MWRRSAASMALSPCISPSLSMCGASRRKISSASRILRALARRLVPKLECDRKATRGVMPKRCTSTADSSAMCASSSALGSSLTKVSAMNSVWFSRMTALSAANFSPGWVPMMLRRVSRWRS